MTHANSCKFISLVTLCCSFKAMSFSCVMLFMGVLLCLCSSIRTSVFEAPQIDHRFSSVPLSSPEVHNQIPNMSFQGVEDYSPWDFTDLDIATTLSSSLHCDYNVLDAKTTHPTMLEAFGEFDNVPSEMNQVMTEGFGFSSTQCDHQVVFDEKSVDSLGYLINYPTDLGYQDVIESSDVSSSVCGSLAFDEMPFREMVESMNTNVPSELCQHEVPVMVDSFSSSNYHSMVFDETHISTMMESFDNWSNVPSVFDPPPLSPIVDWFDYSDIPTPDLSNDEVAGMIESGFPSWGTSDISCLRGTSSRRKYNTQMKIKSDGLEMEDIKQYFNLPITTAAKELKVGVTLLKRRCRELNIRRWPHRKIKSLNSLIETVKGMGLRNEVKMLEQNKRLLEIVPNMGLTKRTKKLRQSIFKANYNKKKMSLSSALG